MKKALKIIEKKSGKILAKELWIADGFWSRFKGLQMRKSLPDGSGMILVPCSSIHMFFMNFPIDALMLDKKGIVTAVKENLRPWRLAQAPSGTHAVLELPAGCAAGIIPGSRLELVGEKPDIPNSLKFLLPHP